MDVDSDDDSYVTIGTPLDTYAEDEVPKKPVQPQDQTVKDSRGRQRFHGAFTGGFSAGYFNSVGSKEGFVPSVFVSARDKKNEAETQRPEDFMDDEDFGEHGIAPKAISATDDFKSQDRKRKDFHVKESDLLKDIVVPSSNNIGIQLLRHLGWKEGQGIGPRVQKKKKKSKGRQSEKVYGCALPAAVSEGSDSEEDEFIPQNVTFAPKDVNPIKFEPKDNHHGLGYSGINPKNMSSSTGHFSLFEPPSEVESTAGFRSKTKDKGGKIGMRGQAFGVGEYEDDDDIDVYSRDSMANYDIAIGGPSKEDKNFGWTAPKHKGMSSAPVGYIGKVLEGFKLSTNTLKPKKIYPAPDLPRNFKPFHIRATAPNTSSEKVTHERKNIDANTRKILLGEINSVFDLVPAADKAKIEAAKTMEITVKKEPDDRNSSKRQTTSRFDSTASTSADINTDSRAKPLYQGSASPAVFKPFGREPAKQARYEKYLENTKTGKKYNPDNIPGCSMTEWERNKEANEFARSAQLYRPMSSLMASRFTTARFDDNEKTVELPADEVTDRNDQNKAVEMKMFGKLTRERYDWHPDKVLCKRFNVANPYPDSTIVGVPKVKRDKYSVFNFLNAASGGDVAGDSDMVEDSSEEDESNESLNKAKDSNMKPLAMLASADGRLESTSVKQAQSSAVQDTKLQQEGSVEGHSDVVKERPSMDIFKAIFSDSDDNSSSSDSENEAMAPIPATTDKSSAVLSSLFGDDAQTEANAIGTIPVESIEERLSPKLQNQESASSSSEKVIFKLPSQSSKSDRIYSTSKTNNDSNSQSRNLSLHKSDISNIDLLSQPPGELSAIAAKQDCDNGRFAELERTRSAEPEGAIWTERVLVDSDESDGKKHKKHKEKLKKKKSSHKKHKKEKKSKQNKHKKKKKKSKKSKKSKKEVIVLSSSSEDSSGSEADSESGHSSNDDDKDKKTLDRLKSLPQNRRPTADDFM